MEGPNHCLACGACCAFYRASFYWAEGDDAMTGGVPVEMTEKLTDFHRVMKGTNQPRPRCTALAGIIGARVNCTIYERRSSICREFSPSWCGGEPNPRCDEARRAWGMSPLEPGIWEPPTKPQRFPRAA